MRKFLQALLCVLCANCVGVSESGLQWEQENRDGDVGKTHKALAAAAGGGAADGAGLVDPKTGALGYSYPFEVPPGRDGMTPSLGLAYSSGALGISDVGLGWTLTGTASIERDTRAGTPTYTSADRYVYRVNNARQTLVYVGAHALGDEYRLFDDTDDLQFLLNAARNTWTVRARNGRVSLFTVSIVKSPWDAPPSLSRVEDSFAWALSKEADANGNTIEYQYSTEVRVSSLSVTATQQLDAPRLVRVAWGGNDGSTGAPLTPHLFQAWVLRYPLAATTAYDAHKPPARDPSCGSANITPKPNYRPSGRLNDGGDHHTVWGVAVEVTAPGTTDGTVRERATRLQRMYRLTYNWDEGGCANANELHQQLRNIEHRAVDESGQWTTAPTVTFEYNGFDRTFERTERTLPSSLRSYSAALPAWQYGLTRTVEASGSSRDAAASLRLQELFDVDFDGVPELLDAHPRFAGPLAVSSLTPTGKPAGAYPWQTGSGFGSDATPLWYENLVTDFGEASTFPRSHALIHGAVPSISPFMAEFWLSTANFFWRDLDGDGYSDLLRWGGRQPGTGQWEFHRNLTSTTGAPAFASPQGMAAAPWESGNPYDWTVRTPDYPWARYMLSGQRSMGFTDMGPWTARGPRFGSISDSVFGELMDVTGDGLIDRVVNTMTDKANGALTVYRGHGDGTFGEPLRMFVGALAEPTLVLTPERTIGMRIDPSTEHWTYTVNTTNDLNGDGLVDFLTRAPLVERYSAQGGSLTRHVVSWSAPFAFMNAGQAGLIAGDANFAPQALGLNYLSDVQVDPGESPVQHSRVAMMDYNGDGYPDLVGAPDLWIQFNRAGRFMSPTAFSASSTGLTVPFNNESVGPSTMLVGKRAVVDINSDGRPDVLSMIQGTNRYEVFTDIDMSAAPGRIKAIVRDSARTEIRYQTAKSAIQNTERALPLPGWVVASVTEKLSGQADRTTRYAYESAVMRRSSERTGSGHLVVPAASLSGYRRTAVCHPNGTQTEFAFDHEGDRSGLLTETVVFGAIPNFTPPTKCGFRRYSTELAADYTRSTTAYAYVDSARSLPNGERLWSRRLERVTNTLRDPETGNQLKQETAHSYATVNGRLVLASTTRRTVPSDTRTRITTYQHAANPTSTGASYLVVQLSQRETDQSGRLLSRRETYYDGQTALGSFTKGNPTKQRQYLTASTYADTIATLDAYGHVTRTTSATGKVNLTCWDRNALYPVRWQGPDKLQGGQVVDYATGQVLESIGAVGSPVTALVCPAVTPQANFSTRIQPVALPAPPLFKRFTATPTVTAPSYEPPASDVTVNPKDYDERSVVAGGLYPYERASNVAEPQTHALLNGVSNALPVATVAALSAAPTVAATSAAYRTRIHYDGLGRVLKVVEPYARATSFTLGERTRASYLRTSTGELTTTIAATTNAATINLATAPQVRRAVDNWGRPTLQERAVAYSGTSVTRWATTNYLYRSTGALESIELPLASGARGNVTTTAWDDLERPTQVRNAAGYTQAVIERFITASDGKVYRVVTSSDESGLVTRMYYDGWSSLVTTEAGAGAELVTSYSYDALGRVVRTVDPNGAVLTTSYDLAGRVIETRRFGSSYDEQQGIALGGASISYDADGRVLSASELDETGTLRTTRYGYDTAGRLTTTTPPTDAGRSNYGVTKYVYDTTATSLGLGRIKRLTSPTEDFDLSYDVRGRLASVKRTVHVVFPQATLSDSYSLAYEYDFGDRPTRIYYRPANTTTGQEITRFEYNPDGSLLRTVDQTRNRELERITQMNDARVVTAVSNAAGATMSLAYDANGRPLKQDVRHSAGTWSHLVTRLPNGLVASTETSDTAGRGGLDKRSYTYDAVARIKGITRAISGIATSELIKYEGNRIGLVSQTQAGATSSLEYRYASHDPSQLTELFRDGSTAQAFIYDAIGTEQSTSSSTRDNDVMGQLHRMDSTRTAPGVGGDIAFVYDEKTDRLYSPAGLWNFTYRRSGTAFVREKVTRVIGSAEVDLGTGLTRFMHRDIQGSPAWTYVTGTTPSFARISYTEYGQSLLSQQALPFTGFQGGFKDPNSERIFFGVRVYDPLSKRWTSRDPVRTNDPYQFNLDNPLAFADASGRDPEPVQLDPLAGVQAAPMQSGSGDLNFTRSWVDANGDLNLEATWRTPLAPARQPAAAADAHTRPNLIDQAQTALFALSDALEGIRAELQRESTADQAARGLAGALGAAAGFTGGPAGTLVEQAVDAFAGADSNFGEGFHTGHTVGVIGSLAIGFTAEVRAAQALAASQACPGGQCGVPGRGCFLADTDVATPDGSRDIGELRVGDRVRTRDDELCKGSAIEKEPLSKVELHQQEGPEELWLTFLRPTRWLQEEGIVTGGTMLLNLDELKVRGWADVLSVEPFDNPAPSAGCVVTSVYRRRNGYVRELHFNHGTEPLFATAGHPFFSLDRQQWIIAEELKLDERVATADGELRLQSRTEHPGVSWVYNLEVDTTHSFLAGRDELWVHNLTPEQIAAAQAAIHAAPAVLGPEGAVSIFVAGNNFEVAMAHEIARGFVMEPGRVTLFIHNATGSTGAVFVRGQGVIALEAPAMAEALATHPAIAGRNLPGTLLMCASSRCAGQMAVASGNEWRGTLGRISPDAPFEPIPPQPGGRTWVTHPPQGASVPEAPQSTRLNRVFSCP